MKTLFKLIISALILWLLFRGMQWHTIEQYFQQIQIGWFIAALIAQLVGSLIAGWRWSLVMGSLGFPTKLDFYLKSYFKGVMFNQVLPTSIGGDAYRMIETSQLGRGKKEAIIGVLVDRVYGCMGLILLNLISLPFAYYLLPPVILNMIIIISLLAIMGLIVLIVLPYLPLERLRKWLGAFTAIGKRIIQSVDSWKDFWLKAILAVLPNFLTVLSFFLLAKSLNVFGGLTSYLTIIPSVMLLTMIPISLAGWGIREGAMVYLGGLVGILKPEALAMSILFGFLLILTSAPGLYFYLKKSHQPKGYTNES